MVVTKSCSGFVIPILTVSTFGLWHAAEATQSLQPTPHVEQRRAEFKPPSDSSLDRDTIVTSTGTYFRPPRDRDRATGPRTSTGTRRGGCLGAMATAFTMLGPNAPDTVLGQTISNRPTFVWHLPETRENQAFPVVFRLLAPDAKDNIPVPIYETTLAYTPGFMTHQVPTTVAALSTGIQYRWQVIVECNPAYPARAMFQELLFTVVPSTSELSQALTTATTDTEQAIAFGQAGVWYDAIAQVAQATTPTDQQTRKGLLTDLAASLPATETQHRRDILNIVEAMP